MNRRTRSRRFKSGLRKIRAGHNEKLTRSENEVCSAAAMTRYFADELQKRIQLEFTRASSITEPCLTVYKPVPAVREVTFGPTVASVTVNEYGERETTCP